MPKGKQAAGLPHSNTRAPPADQELPSDCRQGPRWTRRTPRPTRGRCGPPEGRSVRPARGTHSHGGRGYQRPGDNQPSPGKRPKKNAPLLRASPPGGPIFVIALFMSEASHKKAAPRCRPAKPQQRNTAVAGGQKGQTRPVGQALEYKYWGTPCGSCHSLRSTGGLGSNGQDHDRTGTPPKAAAGMDRDGRGRQGLVQCEPRPGTRTPRPPPPRRRRARIFGRGRAL